MEFEVGQKWRGRDGVLREVLAANSDVVAYRSGGYPYAHTPDVIAWRARDDNWKLIYPKPVPEGWKLARSEVLSFTDHLGGQTRVARQRFSGDGTKVGVTTSGGGAWMNPESLKAAIDYVMSDDD